MTAPASAIRTISETAFLRKAWREISKRNERSRGIDNVTIKAFKSQLDQNLAEIAAELKSGQYKFNKLRPHALRKSGSKKPRPLQIATVRDRVVMKALALYIEPTFNKFNLACSYAFIKNRGVKAATDRIRELLAQGNKYYFESDIINFFGAVDKQFLWRMFSKEIRHRSLLPLLQQSFNLELEDLGSYDTEFQNLFLGVDSGIPQGGVLSPMLANFYLHEFDRRMTRSGLKLIRYADDFVVMCESGAHALEAYKESQTILRTLGLDIHELNIAGSKSRIGYYPKDGLIFLGIRFEGKEIFPSGKAVKRFKSKIADILKPNSGATLFKTLQTLANIITGWGKCYRSMKVENQYLELDEYVKSAVQTYLEKMGVRLVGKNRRKQLKFLGVPSLTAMLDRKKRSLAGGQGAFDVDYRV